jgi:hypothetical protein
MSRASDAVRCQMPRRSTLLLVWPFVPNRRLLRPLLTSRSVLPRRPFNHKARSPRVRTHSFTARPPDLRRLILDHKSFAELRPLALIAPPCIRFLFIGPQLRSTLPPHGRSPFRSCASLRSLWSARERTFTSKSAPVPGARNYPPAKPGALTIAGPSKGPYRNRKSRARHSALNASTSSFQARMRRRFDIYAQSTSTPTATPANVKLLRPPRQSRGGLPDWSSAGIRSASRENCTLQRFSF